MPDSILPRYVVHPTCLSPSRPKQDNIRQSKYKYIMKNVGQGGIEILILRSHITQSMVHSHRLVPGPTICLLSKKHPIWLVLVYPCLPKVSLNLIQPSHAKSYMKDHEGWLFGIWAACPPHQATTSLVIQHVLETWNSMFQS